MATVLRPLVALLVLLLTVDLRDAAAQAANTTERKPDVVYVPTPQPVVEKMLEMARVTDSDIVYDLGSGDGRIPITAAKKHGARALGIDIDPKRVDEANRNAKRAGVTDKVSFVRGDLFQTDLSEATVITLYLLPNLNLKLKPVLQQLKPGTRIVSHNFSMGDWPPDQTVRVGSSVVYLWTVREGMASTAP